MNFFVFLLFWNFAVSQTKYYTEMTDSEMIRNPESWQLDFSTQPRWNYGQGLVLGGIWQVYIETGEKKYFDYVKSYADTLIKDNGHGIETYSMEEYSLDNINAGKILFALYKETGDEKYKNTMDLLREQMRNQPRVSEGGFWHKGRFPYQMWLDGLYMGSPFIAEYGATFDDPELFDDVALQITLIANKTYEEKTKLYYHGWDEKKEQPWANPETGCSASFWSRSIGWYSMALVDSLDFIPLDHPKRPAIIDIAQRLAESLEKFRDPESGMWYQVTDQMGREGNYLESSGSMMFIYMWVKGAQKGYLNQSYLEKGKEAYEQFLKQFIVNNSDGTITVTQCCSVAVLNEDGRGDGTFDYYISEPIRSNDPKVVGPFIRTSYLLDK
jgi:unsaturated rhamnogalacturonyl hydrolase